LLARLSIYGELYPAEVDRAAQRWLPLLTKAGWAAPLADGACVATNAYLALPADLSELERLRRVCFAIPAYQCYLVAVLAEGLVKAGQLDGYYEQLEQWVAHDLAGVAGEINALLDELETSQERIVEWPPQRVTACFADWHARHEPFTNWDRALLGLSGTPEHLFTAILGHTDAFAIPRPAVILGDMPVALLPDFDLTKEEGGLGLPPYASWSTDRQSVHSSLPFFDAQGKPLYDVQEPVSIIWQDVLAQQPYYRSVLRTAIAVRFSSYGPDALTLFVLNGLSDARVLLGGRERGKLVDLLPGLVARMGYRALCRPSPERVGRILEHWITVGVFDVVNGSHIFLHESYARTLHERRRATMLLRGSAREEQVRIERFLKEIA
jgi:hypothetical protein